jgi:uncharacterized membrane protein
VTKKEFLIELNRRICTLPLDEINRSIAYYSELIDDKMENDGMSEEEAVDSLGSLNEITYNILDSVSMGKLVSEKTRRVKEEHSVNSHKLIWVIVAVVTCPIWLSLLFAAVMVVASVYVALWAVVLSLVFADLAVFLSGILCIVLCIFIGSQFSFASVLTTVGIGFLAMGIGILLYHPLLSCARAMINVIRGLWTKIKYRFFVQKEAQA